MSASSMDAAPDRRLSRPEWRWFLGGAAVALVVAALIVSSYWPVLVLLAAVCLFLLATPRQRMIAIGILVAVWVSTIALRTFQSTDAVTGPPPGPPASPTTILPG